MARVFLSTYTALHLASQTLPIMLWTPTYYAKYYIDIINTGLHNSKFFSKIIFALAPQYRGGFRGLWGYRDPTSEIYQRSQKSDVLV